MERTSCIRSGGAGSRAFLPERSRPGGRVRSAAPGFTLIEMIVTIVVLGILAALGAPMLLNGLQAYGSTSSDLGTLSKLRYATERMAREIREVQYTGGAYTMTTAYPTATSLSFTKDDGVGTVVTITAIAPDVTLSYSSPAVSAILVDQVSSLSFAYFQADDVTPATSNSNVAFVQINLTLQNPNNAQSYSQRTTIALRDRS